jgi:hypothetical protein
MEFCYFKPIGIDFYLSFHSFPTDLTVPYIKNVENGNRRFGGAT